MAEGESAEEAQPLAFPDIPETIAAALKAHKRLVQLNEMAGNQQRQLAQKDKMIAALQQQLREQAAKATELLRGLEREKAAAEQEVKRLAALPGIRKVRLEQALAMRKRLEQDIIQLEAPPEPEPEPEQ